MRPLILCLLLAGCTTAGLREREPFAQVASAKSVSAIQDCLSRQWEGRSGVTSVSPRSDGVTMSLTYQVFSSPLPAAVIDVKEQGSSRLVTTYAHKGEGKKLREELAACV